ncbi:MAG: hypothetical protein V1790_17000 [Planctomycetota bacterium]
MADHIPFITSVEGLGLARKLYGDSQILRVPLDRAEKLKLKDPGKLWLDPCVDGLDNLEKRRGAPDKKNSWFEFMKDLPHFHAIGTPSHQANPVDREVDAFVRTVLDRCAAYNPAWITVPQLPVVDGSDRNNINGEMATATGEWRRTHGFSGRFILPLVFTNQRQINLKTARNPKVQQAERCYEKAQADGFWVVDKTLPDDNGSPTLGQRRFPGLIALHKELNARISAKITIAGPYWALNVVLWARGLVDFPAIGVGSGYQYFLAGSMAQKAKATLMLKPLRRRVDVGPELRTWLDTTTAKLAPTHPAYAEFSDIKKRYTLLRAEDVAKEQVARSYKQWFDLIAAIPQAGRSMALYQDLSSAYALGKSLSDFENEGTARRPEAVAESLMLSCL